MPTFPTFTRDYAIDGYSFEVSPDVKRTQFYSGNSRQRYFFQNRNDIFNVNLVLSDSELETFEGFVTTDINYGADQYTGPYFTSDVEQTGTLELINGAYSCELIPPSHWKVGFSFELKNRTLTEENNIYDVVNDLGTISNTELVVDALADMVNNNTL